MKLFINHLNKENLKKQLELVKDIDFSLFIDAVPQDTQDLSSINIIVLQEPNEYFGLHDWVIQNKHLFNIILTWDDKVLNNCDNAMFLPFGHTWFKSNQYEKEHIKEFKIAHLRGNLLKSYGHQIRWEILDRKNLYKLEGKSYNRKIDIYNIQEAEYII